ncbi:methyltransferase domain-containing protein [Chitiniphilus purpureus]|uniref:Methyltransferase domain-containing protein n=1 Tax=Chitiniphilus purpureus TaxID=2981137 RepID=A0ABY6DII6_9NEIS|nr:methyltransferase domain-containing protein [Chitiniphilus sp. CD1]UXY14155.1 methyltransferase domain-containing protein [Chitiniphilus sp. CD1]
MSAVPARLRWAARLLAPTPGQRILEIGCGSGVALGLVSPQLGQDGHIVGVDRSAKAIAACAARHRAVQACGRMALLQGEFETMAFDSGAFDSIFAVNVNAFWLKPAPSFGALRPWLAPRGSVLLVYAPPDPARLEQIVATCCAALPAVALACHAIVPAPADAPGMLAIVAQAR